MAQLKSGSVVAGSPILTQSNHGSSGDPHSQYKLITELVAEYYTSAQTDAAIAAVVPDLEAERIAAEAAVTAAAVSETNAAASATAAATSATAASSSETAVELSATAAATSEANAATSETNAGVSASNAATSETNAAASATAAATSATNAATSETNAATSATNASTAQTAAEAAKTAAETAYDDFDDRYLGQKASDPTLDNDGNALLTGALYFNTTTTVMKVYTGTVWQDVAPIVTTITASQISDVTATATELNYVDGVTSPVQSQLDSKLALSGGTMTGDITLASTQYASQVEAEAGIDNIKLMTPLRTKQSIDANVPAVTPSNEYKYLQDNFVSGSYDLDISSYGVFDLNVVGDTTFTVSGLSPSDSFVNRLKLKDAGSHTITFPSEFIIDPSIEYLSGSWNVANAVDTNKTFTYIGGDTTVRGVAFKPDGTKMYHLFRARVEEFDLTTAWDISTASQVGLVTVNGQDVQMSHMVLKPDGTEMWLLGDTGNTIFHYNLTTAWDITTAVYDNVSYVVAERYYTYGTFNFKPDGTKFFLAGQSPYEIFEYTLTTAWDITTASLSGNSFVPGTTIRTAYFKDDGVRFFINTHTHVNEYIMSTPWDLTTATSTGRSLETDPSFTSNTWMTLSTDGTYVYFKEAQSVHTMHQYFMNTADEFNLTQYGSEVAMTKLGELD